MSETKSRSTSTILLVLVACVAGATLSWFVSGRRQQPNGPRAAGVQVVCYGQQGQPLFPPQVLSSVELDGTDSDDVFRGNYENGLRVWFRASTCIAAEMSQEDVAALKSKTASPPPPKPALPPQDAGPAKPTK